MFVVSVNLVPRYIIFNTLSLFDIVRKMVRKMVLLFLVNGFPVILNFFMN